ncbi:MAG: hypothetical protein ACYCSB_03890 [bacterium]
MTVKELKEKLNGFNENLEVSVATGDLRSDSIKSVECSKPCMEDDEEGEELTRKDVVWIEI